MPVTSTAVLDAAARIAVTFTSPMVIAVTEPSLCTSLSVSPRRIAGVTSTQQSAGEPSAWLMSMPATVGFLGFGTTKGLVAEEAIWTPLRMTSNRPARAVGASVALAKLSLGSAVSVAALAVTAIAPAATAAASSSRGVKRRINSDLAILRLRSMRVVSAFCAPRSALHTPRTNGPRPPKVQAARRDLCARSARAGRRRSRGELSAGEWVAYRRIGGPRTTIGVAAAGPPVAVSRIESPRRRADVTARLPAGVSSSVTRTVVPLSAMTARRA